MLRLGKAKVAKEFYGQGLIQKKSASGSRMLPFVIFDKKVPFSPKVVLF